MENNKVVAVNELKLIADNNKLNKLKSRLLKRLEELGNDEENINIEEIDRIINTIDKIDKFCNNNNGNNNNNNGNNNNNKINFPDKAINTKEDIQALKSLTLGNEEFEDWQLLRKTFRLGIIKILYSTTEK